MTRQGQGLIVHGQHTLQAYAELLHFAGKGDVLRLQDIAERHRIKLSDISCDYEQRTPLHVAAAEGQLSTVNWLLVAKSCNPNLVDRFSRTPLEYALLGDHLQVQALLIEHGGKVWRKGAGLVDYRFTERRSWDGISESHMESRRRSKASSSASMDRASFDNFWPGSSTTSGGGASLTHKALAGVPGLFRQRGASELGGLCLGPLIGRGSYARVYKGTWRGGTVAVKVLSHDGDRASRLRALHESMVCAKIVHPNVVMTYKVHTVRQNASTAEQAEGQPLLRPFQSCTAAAETGSSKARVSRSPSFRRSHSDEVAFSAFAHAARAAFLPIDDATLQTVTPRRVPGTAGAPGMAFAGDDDDELERQLSPRLSWLATKDSITLRSRSLHVEPAVLPSPFQMTVERALSATPAATSGGGAAAESPVDMLARRMSVDLIGAADEACMSGLSGELSAGQDEYAGTGMFLGEERPSDEAGPCSEGEDYVETLLVMEHAELGTLHSHLLAGLLRGSMVNILLCLFDVAAGMNYLHSIGIMHSDLKAANVLLKSSAPTQDDPRGYICKIADFGLSRVLEDDMTHVFTNNHGTVAYTAPETLHTGTMGTPADVFSFAMLMLELWTGELVYKGVRSHMVLLAVFSGQKPDVPGDMPAHYRTLMERCWATEPAQRPTFIDVAAQLAAMLAAARAQQEATPPEPSPPAPAQGGSARGAPSPFQAGAA